MKKSSVTIYDIAKVLKISASTVSRALKDHPGISVKTKEEVLRVAKELGYQPNTVAASLRVSKTNVIGVIVPKIAHHFFSESISGIQEIAHTKGYNVIICQSNEKYKRELLDTKTLFSSRVDGLIVSLSMETINNDHFKLFYDRNIPLIFYDRICPDLDTIKIIGDDFQGAFKATEHLISMGCKRIAHFAGMQNVNTYAERLRGYKTALEKYNIPYEIGLVNFSELTHESGLKAIINALNKDNPPDGIFAANDTCALSAVMYAKRIGLNVPNDLAVVGYSNLPSTSFIEPSITTIEQSARKMGEIAANKLIDLIESDLEKIKPETITIPIQLIERQSSLKRKIIVN